MSIKNIYTEMEIVKRSIKDKLFFKKHGNYPPIKIKHNNNKTDLGIGSAHEELTSLELSSHIK